MDQSLIKLDLLFGVYFHPLRISFSGCESPHIFSSIDTETCELCSNDMIHVLITHVINEYVLKSEASLYKNSENGNCRCVKQKYPSAAIAAFSEISNAAIGTLNRLLICIFQWYVIPCIPCYCN